MMNFKKAQVSIEFLIIIVSVLFIAVLVLTILNSTSQELGVQTKKTAKEFIEKIKTEQPSAPATICGDNVCEGTETTINCPEDCSNAPTVDFLYTIITDPPRNVAFDGSCTDSGTSGSIKSCVLDYGDNSSTEFGSCSGNGCDVTFTPATTGGTHVYSAAGTYNVTLTAIDYNDKKAVLTKSITIQ